MSLSALLSVLASRANDVSIMIGFMRWRVIALAYVNSLRPSGPWMRPKPDCPTPPNGRPGTAANAMTELTDVMPERTRRAMSTTFLLVNNEHDSPYAMAFVR